ncbi:MAG: metallophosphoesterase [Candidatus Bathyarchaeota archaeon]
MKKQSICKIIILLLILLGLNIVPKMASASKSNITNIEEKFSIIVLPDTQYYSAYYPWIFENQTRWIIENKESLNIVFVTHLGDLVDHWQNEEEWNNANVSMSILDGKIPYGVLPGNHDGADSGGNLTNYNKYFGVNRFMNETWYGGACDEINTNSYQLFSAGEKDFLIFHLEFNPSDDILLWAGSVIEKYPNNRVIVSTHDYVDGYDSNSRTKNGEKIWNKLIKPYSDQIFLVLCGHWENEIRITSLVDDNYVHQLLSDYQDRTKGGNGWLRIIEYSPKKDEIKIKTYSPYLNKFETDSNSEFTLDDQITYYNIFFPLYRYFPLITIILITTIIVIFFIRKRKQKNSKMHNKNKKLNVIY